MRCVLLVISMALLAKSALTPPFKPWLIEGQPYLEDLALPARISIASAAEAGLLNASRCAPTAGSGSAKVSDACERHSPASWTSVLQQHWD